MSGEHGTSGEHGEHGEHGDHGGSGGHSVTEPFPTGQAGQHLDIKQKLNTLLQAIANGQVNGLVDGAEAGVAMDGTPGYSSAELANQLQGDAIQLAGEYDLPWASLDIDQRNVIRDALGNTGIYGPMAPDIVAAAAAEANNPPPNAEDGAIPLRRMDPDARRTREQIRRELPQDNNPPYSEDDAKESLLRSKWLWGGFIGLLFVGGLSIFLVFAFKNDWWKDKSSALPDDGDCDDPHAKDIASEANTKGEAVTLDIVANVEPECNPVDGRSVILVGAPADQRKLVVDEEGTWSVDATSGQVTFTPDTSKLVKYNPMPVRYQIRDVVGTVSNAASLVVKYAGLTDRPAMSTPPLARPAIDRSYIVDGSTTPVHIDPITVDMTQFVEKGSKDIDWSTLRISQRMPVIDMRPDGVTATTVEGEGTWSVNTAAKTITFTPINTQQEQFQGVPTPIIYWVEDVDGNRSTPQMVILNKFLGDLEVKIIAMGKKDDKTFWSDFKTNVIDTNLSLNVVFGIVAMLDLAVAGLMSNAVRVEALGDPEDRKSTGYRFTGDDYRNTLAQWDMASVSSLYSIVEAATTARFNAVTKPVSPLVIRLIRLRLMRRMTRDAFVTLAMMKKAQQGGVQG